MRELIIVSGEHSGHKVHTSGLEHDIIYYDDKEALVWNCVLWACKELEIHLCRPKTNSKLRIILSLPIAPDYELELSQTRKRYINDWILHEGLFDWFGKSWNPIKENS